MSVHYKFNAAKEFDTLPVDGLHISLVDLKEAIVHHKRLGRGDLCDLQVTNAETKEVYVDEKSLIPKNSSLIIARIPIDPSHKKLGDLSRDDKELLLSNPEYRMNTEGAEEAEQLSRRLEEVPDLTKFAGTEDEKISAMIAQSTIEFHPSRYLKLRNTVMHGKVPPFYKCYKCHQGGHWVSNCPLNNQDLRKSTGIPSKFLMEVNDPNTPGVMITANGKYVIFRTNLVMGGESRAVVKGPLPSKTPAELTCLLCKEIMKDAVIVPCCTAAFCDDCIRNHLLDSDDHICPECHKKEVGPDTLIPNRYLRLKIQQFGHQFFTEMPPLNELDIASRSPSPAIKEIISRSVSPTLTLSPGASIGTPEIKVRNQSELMENPDSLKSPSDKENEADEDGNHMIGQNIMKDTLTENSMPYSSPIRSLVKEGMPASPIEVVIKDAAVGSPREHLVKDTRISSPREHLVKDAMVSSILIKDLIVSPLREHLIKDTMAYSIRENLVKDAIYSPPLEIIAPDDEQTPVSKSRKHLKKNKKKQKEAESEGKDKKHRKKDKEKKKKSKKKNPKDDDSVVEDEETKADELERLNTSLLLNEAICPTFDPSVPPPINVSVAPGYVPQSNNIPTYPAQYPPHIVGHGISSHHNYPVPSLENNDPLATFTKYLREKDERKRKKLSRSPSRTPPYRGRSVSRSRSRSRLKQQLGSFARSRSRSNSKPRSPSRRARALMGDRSPPRRRRFSPSATHHSYHSPSSRDRSLTLSRSPSPGRHFKGPHDSMHHYQNPYSPPRLDSAPQCVYPIINQTPAPFANSYEFPTYQYNQAMYDGYGNNFYDNRGRGFIRGRGRRGFPFEGQENRVHSRGSGVYSEDQIRRGGRSSFDHRRVEDRRPTEELRRSKERFIGRVDEEEWRRRKELEEEWDRRNHEKRSREHRHHSSERRKSPGYRKESSLERYSASRSKRELSPHNYDLDKYSKRKLIESKEGRLDSKGRGRSRERYEETRRSRSYTSIPRERKHSPRRDLENDRKVTPNKDFDDERRKVRDRDLLKKDDRKFKKNEHDKKDKISIRDKDVKIRDSEPTDIRREKLKNRKEKRSEEIDRNLRLEKKEDKLHRSSFEKETNINKEISKDIELNKKDVPTSKIEREKKKHDKKKKKKDKRRASQNSEIGEEFEGDDEKKKKKKERKKHKHVAGPESLPQDGATMHLVDSDGQPLKLHESMEAAEEQKRAAEQMAAVAAYLPELSKWERDDEDVGSPTKLNARKDSNSKGEPSLVTSDVLKRAENALFSKDTAIRNRPLSLKKKDPENETREAKKKGSSIQITISSKTESQIGRIKISKSDSVVIEQSDELKIIDAPELPVESDVANCIVDDAGKGKKRDHSVGKEPVKSKKLKYDDHKNIDERNLGSYDSGKDLNSAVSKVKETSPGLSNTRVHMLKVAEASSSVKDDNLAPNVSNDHLTSLPSVELNFNDDQTVTSSEEAKVIHNKSTLNLSLDGANLVGKETANGPYIENFHGSELVTQSISDSYNAAKNQTVVGGHSVQVNTDDLELEEGELIETSSKEEELPDSTFDQKSDIKPSLYKDRIEEEVINFSKVENVDQLCIERAKDELGPGLNIDTLEPPPQFLKRNLTISKDKVKDKKIKKKKKEERLF